MRISHLANMKAVCSRIGLSCKRLLPCTRRAQAENKREGELVKLAAQEEVELNRAKALAATARSVAAAKATAAANQQLLLFKEAERMRDSEDDKRIAAFLAAKEATMQERKTKLEMRQADANAKRDRTIKVLEAQLMQARHHSGLALPACFSLHGACIIYPGGAALVLRIGGHGSESERPAKCEARG